MASADCTGGFLTDSFSAEPAVIWSNTQLSIVNFSQKNTKPAVLSLALVSVSDHTSGVV
jgi:hypothetical protein